MTERRTKGKRHLLPGFGLTMGVTLLYLAVIVVIPLAAMLLKTSSLEDAFKALTIVNRAQESYLQGRRLELA